MSPRSPVTVGLPWPLGALCGANRHMGFMGIWLGGADPFSNKNSFSNKNALILGNNIRKTRSLGDRLRVLAAALETDKAE